MPRHELTEEFGLCLEKHSIRKGLCQGQLRRCPPDFWRHHSSVAQYLWHIRDIPGILCERFPRYFFLWRWHDKLPHQGWGDDEMFPYSHIYATSTHMEKTKDGLFHKNFSIDMIFLWEILHRVFGVLKFGCTANNPPIARMGDMHYFSSRASFLFRSM